MRIDFKAHSAIKQEDIIMSHEEFKNVCAGGYNKCIACTVTQCANHAKTENYCALEKIQIGTHEANPTMNECTDCQSFVNANG